LKVKVNLCFHDGITTSKMSSSEVEMKAGHPPAVKAGGMRVARTRQTSTGEGKEKPEMTKEEIEEFGTSPPKTEKQVMVSGALAKEEKAFPPEAVKQYHEKPLPSKDLRPIQTKHSINQPK
jgi:ABC-type phosphate/phosphonate transport system substrate-binding protein